MQACVLVAVCTTRLIVRSRVKGAYLGEVTLVRGTVVGSGFGELSSSVSSCIDGVGILV